MQINICKKNIRKEKISEDQCYGEEELEMVVNVGLVEESIKVMCGLEMCTPMRRLCKTNQLCETDAIIVIEKDKGDSMTGPEAEVCLSFN